MMLGLNVDGVEDVCWVSQRASCCPVICSAIRRCDADDGENVDEDDDGDGDNGDGDADEGGDDEECNVGEGDDGDGDITERCHSLKVGICREDIRQANWINCMMTKIHEGHEGKWSKTKVKAKSPP